jgi:phospholipase C
MAAGAAHDLWILGPSGFHRHFRGLADGEAPAASIVEQRDRRRVQLRIANPSNTARRVIVTPAAYGDSLKPWSTVLKPGGRAENAWDLTVTQGWYDLQVTCEGLPGFAHRFAGRIETGRDSMTDPAMAGAAIMQWA